MRLHPWASLIFLSFQLVFSISDNTNPTEDTMDLFTLDNIVMDNIPIEDNSDLFEPTVSQLPDQYLTSSAELTAAGGESCHMGKKRDGSSCAAPFTLETPSLLDVFKIGDESGKTGSDSSSDANTWDWNNVIDPCLLEAPYIIHLCCHGKLGPRYGAGWAFIDKCVTGEYLPIHPISFGFDQLKMIGRLRLWVFFSFFSLFSCSYAYVFLEV